MDKFKIGDIVQLNAEGVLAYHRKKAIPFEIRYCQGGVVSDKEDVCGEHCYFDQYVELVDNSASFIPEDWS